MSRMARIKVAVASAMLACTVSGAIAADLFGSDAPPVVYGEKRQEFGTGWYLRGDVSWTRDKAPSLFADATFGNISTKNILGATVGFGYKLNSWFRTDMTLDWRATEKTTRVSPEFACPIEIRGLNAIPSGTPVGIYAVNNQCRSVEQSKLQRGALLANGYLDLGSWSGVTPYVGAGIGVAYGRINGNSDWRDMSNGTPYRPTLALPTGYPIIWLDQFGNPVADPGINFGAQDPSRRISQTKFNFAFALMAGFAVDISPNAKLDFGYRYLNMGKWGNASAANSSHDFRMGFRYAID